MNLVAFLCMIALTLWFSLSESQSKAQASFIQKYFQNLRKSGYDKNVMPVVTEGKPLNISLSIFVLDLYGINEEKMEFKAKFFFRQLWKDPRLAYESPDNHTIMLSSLKDVWTPDLYFPNGVDGFLHDDIDRQSAYSLIREDGSVIFSEKVTVTFSCPMNFNKYPQDTHECYIRAESFKFDRDKVEVLWHDDSLDSNLTEISVRMTGDINTPFEVKLVNGTDHIEKMTNGEYTYIQANFIFQRKIGYFITALYLPYIFLGVLSWLTFWIPLKLFPHRLSLLLLTIYLMVSIASDINAMAPKTSYTKGSDVWIAVCQTLVFASFLEFVVVHLLVVNKAGFKEKPCANKPEETVEPSITDEKVNNVNNQDACHEASNKICNFWQLNHLEAGGIEATSRILFPVLFICFNFIYWLVY